VFGVQEPARGAALEAALLSTMDAVWPPSIMIRWLQRDLGPFTPWRRFVRARERADAMIREEIAARRAAPGDDILSLMLAARYDDGEAMSDPQLRDELLTLLAAGHETTAIALAWAMYWLHRARTPSSACAPSSRPSATTPTSTPSPSSPTSMPSATRPPPLPDRPARPAHAATADDPRRARDPRRRARRRLHVLVHRHPALYPEPDAFRPERWLARKFAAWEFTPFGGGIRRCIGAAFAVYEMKQVLAAILPRHRLRLADDTPIGPARRNITLGPRGGVRMILTERTG
jgi:cytochrome P450